MFRIFLQMAGLVLVSVSLLQPAYAGSTVEFGEAFGLPSGFSVDRETGEPVRNTVRGVPAALQPWWVKRGEAKVRHDGTINARVDYLVFAGGNAIGTPGPIDKVILTLFCGQNAFSTGPVDLMPEGMIRVKFQPLEPMPPKNCENPALLVRIAIDGNPGPWIAAFAPEE